MADQDEAESSPSWSEQLRRDGERDLSDRDAWQKIVAGEQLAEEAAAAKRIVDDVLQRSPLRSWVPGSSWEPVAVVGDAEDEPWVYPDWQPAGRVAPAWRPMAFAPIGLVVQPYGDLNPFSLLLAGWASSSAEPIDLQVVLCRRVEQSLTRVGPRTGWLPLVNVTGRERLARALAAPADHWPPPPLRTPKYGWDVEPDPAWSRDRQRPGRA